MAKYIETLDSVEASLAKHVAEAAGLAAVVRALVSSDPRAFDEATGHTGEVWRSRWLSEIGASAPRTGP